jgi:pyruvate carboxylase
MCANRGEIAIRVFRAATELGMRTVAIYSHEDRVHLHRYKADEGYRVGEGLSPVGAYLSIDEVMRVAREADVDAVHPGYGFLSENPDLSAACAEAGVAFVGPPPEVLRALGDKTSARDIAKAAEVPVVPGSEGPVETLDDARAFADDAGYPVIIKAAMGGGGRGMRVVRAESELSEAFERARSEAESAFGDGTVFVERFVENPRHVEVQILADATGEVMHLFERDCSVQRRHQKVVEMAPAFWLDTSIREALWADAVKIAKSVGYRNAGTVEFLVDREGRHYFIEVNPRIQVEHTVTEEVTGVDLVQSQLRIAGGATLSDLGLSQQAVGTRGVAVQCRVTTEDPKNGFAPDHGRIEVFRTGAGMGIRLDGGSGYAGARVSPDYDSLLVKVTAHALTFDASVDKLRRALTEFRVRGVSTNIPFLTNVLTHPRFASGDVDTTFVDDTPSLVQFPARRNRAQKLLRFLADVAVNGPRVPGMSANPPANVTPPIPTTPAAAPPDGWRAILQEEGPIGFARAVRSHGGLLVTDTTFRDAHQSLLMTRVRTADIAAIAPATAQLLPQLFSLEMWGGATFDVALRFLRECPWARLERLRALIPNIPFQMLLRGANAVGYTSYPDNVVRAFVAEAKDRGIDVFRIFDSLNYVENLALGIDAVGEAGGVIEASVCYTGDVSDPTRTKYSLGYYVDLAGQLVERGIHVLNIKDMAGLLKPAAATKLVSALREAFTNTPIHVHTHDTGGAGVAAMLAAADAGADVVDLALPAMAGLTSQPTMAAIIQSVRGSRLDTEIDPEAVMELNAYWESARGLYAPFETGLTGYAPDLHDHEIPGGQYTNLQFQARALGLESRWRAIKRAYAAANRILGDIIKVTPSSKVVGDLAQFMVQNDLSEEEVLTQAETLSFPSSVVDFLAGRIGQPLGGFPEPFRTQVLKGRETFDGRPGASLPPLDLEGLRRSLEEEHGAHRVGDHDVLSASLYPEVFRDYRRHREHFGDVSILPTRAFLAPLSIGEEIAVDIERGKTLIVLLTAVGELDATGHRVVYFELNGQPRQVRVRDEAATDVVAENERATEEPGSVGAPMPGTVVSIAVEKGAEVAEGDALVVLSAMKMETVVASPVSGVVSRIAADVADVLAAGDLLVEIVVGNTD